MTEQKSRSILLAEAVASYREFLMHPTVRRVLLNSLLTAALLGGIGLALARMTTLSLGGGAAPAVPGRGVATSGPGEDFTTALQWRVPLFMALWGVVIVVAGEGILHVWRKRSTTPAAVQSRPDPAEELLEELLAKAEAMPPDVGVQTPAPRVGKLELQPDEGTPSAQHESPQPAK